MTPQTKMASSQRPFFLSAFLAAIRPHPANYARYTSPGTGASANGTSSPVSSSPPSTSPGNHHRNLTTTPNSRTNHTHTTTNTTATHNSSPARPRPIPSNASNSTTATTAFSTSPLSADMTSLYPQQQQQQQQMPPTLSSQQRRRGSNSSSEGFREVPRSEAWYIGGQTASGEERFFKLGIMRRGSTDRLSLDRLSL